MKKETAVEWLARQVKDIDSDVHKKMIEAKLLEEAIERQKQDMIQFADNFAYYFNFGGEEQPDGSIVVLNSEEYFHNMFNNYPEP